MLSGLYVLAIFMVVMMAYDLFEPREDDPCDDWKGKLPK